jgi:hypothetical protein
LHSRIGDNGAENQQIEQDDQSQQTQSQAEGEAPASAGARRRLAHRLSVGRLVSAEHEDPRMNAMSLFSVFAFILMIVLLPILYGEAW